ncbi:MAG: hypothetical protein ABIF71_04310 [Planctomycetota bacterium]
MVQENMDGIHAEGKDPREEKLEIVFQKLSQSLKLPCDVRGREDFRWEESYIIGAGDLKKHTQLRQTRPSFLDTYELLGMENGICSEWMRFPFDIAAWVRRKSDGAEFVLGLVELTVVNQRTKNYKLLNEYSEWHDSNR